MHCAMKGTKVPNLAAVSKLFIKMKRSLQMSHSTDINRYIMFA